MVVKCAVASHPGLALAVVLNLREKNAPHGLVEQAGAVVRELVGQDAAVSARLYMV